MTFYGVEVDLYNRNGTAYKPFGTAEYEDADAHTKAFEYAHKRVALYPNASACILRNGDPYAWVFNGTTDYAGVDRRDTSKPRIDYVGGAMPEWAYH